MAYIGQIIQKLRRRQMISQGELAEKLQISVQAISKWETGKANPDVLLLPQIAKLLGVTIDELFCGEEENSPYGEVLELNHTGWNQVAETKWKGTYLPDYGPYTPSEDVLCLFGDVRGKKCWSWHVGVGNH